MAASSITTTLRGSAPEKGLTWSARVRGPSGESFSVIDGQVNVGAGDVDLEVAVRRIVETSIEHRIGVN
jgi:hypothetical protein